MRRQNIPQPPPGDPPLPGAVPNARRMLAEQANRNGVGNPSRRELTRTGSGGRLRGPPSPMASALRNMPGFQQMVPPPRPPQQQPPTPTGGALLTNIPDRRQFPVQPKPTAQPVKIKGGATTAISNARSKYVVRVDGANAERGIELPNRATKLIPHEPAPKQEG